MSEEKRQFDRYTIERELGAGGMGRVYLAHDPRLNRRVALKVLLDEHALSGSSGSSLAARLLREARSAAAFQHPNAVTVFDVGEFEGAPYISMEYVEGKPLRARASAASMSQRLRWLIEVARALGAAHKAGIIHRDIKPDNVIISTDGQAKVVDFGISRRPSLPADAQSPTVDSGMETVTAAGQIVGTPLYMAPEQIQAGQVTDKTDQFSWGVMAYEVLTGSVPWGTGDTLQVIARIVTSTPAAMGEAARDIPEPVERVIMRALARSPDDRFDSMEVVAAELEPHIEGASVCAPPQPSDPPPDKGPVSTDVAMARTGPRATEPVVAGGKGSVRWQGYAIAVGLVAVVILGGRALRKPQAPAAVATSSQAASAAPSAPSIKRPELGLRALEDHRAPRGAAVSNLRSESLWTTAQADFEAASRQPGAPLHWSAAAVFCKGQAAMMRGDLDVAIASMRLATDTEPQWEGAWVGLSAVLTARQETAEALMAAQTAQRIDPSWWVAVAQGARVLSAARRLDEAIQEYRRALSLAPNDAVLLSEVALVYHASRMDAEAERYARKAIEQDPDMASVRVILAERALERGEGTVALDEASRAVAVSPKSASPRLALADALALLKRRDEAMAEYRKAIDLADASHDQGVPAERLRVVREALKKGVLPAPRSSKAPRTRGALGIGGMERSSPVLELDESRTAPDRGEGENVTP